MTPQAKSSRKGCLLSEQVTLVVSRVCLPGHVAVATRFGLFSFAHSFCLCSSCALFRLFRVLFRVNFGPAFCLDFALCPRPVPLKIEKKIYEARPPLPTMQKQYKYTLRWKRNCENAPVLTRASCGEK